MILVTHSLIGAALTHRLSDYSAVFFIALVSHYIFDMIPHWHYGIPRVKRAVEASFGKKTLRLESKIAPDVFRIAIDFTLGLLLALYFFDGTWRITVVAVLGAVLPDLLVGLARLWPASALVWHDRFHRWIHARTDLDHRPLFGIATQSAIALIFVVVFGV